MVNLPHRDKLKAALKNPKCRDDRSILNEAYNEYENWISRIGSIKSIGREKVNEMVALLNEYKDSLEVDLIAKKGSSFIKRQKGQLKLDNSVMEEFLMYLIDPTVFKNLPSDFEIEKGPHTAFMSLSFRPAGLKFLNQKPEVVLKVKDQDFTLGKSVYYKFSSDPDFETNKTLSGELFLAILAAEIKVNLDKTMFQECSGTASRLKQGCPISKYFVLVEYLDMLPEDCRLTDINNVFLLRKTRRLPFEKRSIFEEVKRQHEEFSIDKDVIWNFVQEIQTFIDSVWYDPKQALIEGSFV